MTTNQTAREDVEEIINTFAVTVGDNGLLLNPSAETRYRAVETILTLKAQWEKEAEERTLTRRYKELLTFCHSQPETTDEQWNWLQDMVHRLMDAATLSTPKKEGE